MNVVIGFHKAFNGQKLSYREQKAVTDGLADREVCDEYMDMMGRIVKTPRPKSKRSK
jgi:hypothetical protein